MAVTLSKGACPLAPLECPIVHAGCRRTQGSYGGVMSVDLAWAAATSSGPMTNQVLPGSLISCWVCSVSE